METVDVEWMVLGGIAWHEALHKGIRKGEASLSISLFLFFKHLLASLAILHTTHLNKNNVPLRTKHLKRGRLQRRCRTSRGIYMLCWICHRCWRRWWWWWRRCFELRFLRQWLWIASRTQAERTSFFLWWDTSEVPH